MTLVKNGLSKVPHCPEDYRLWQETMYTQFGQKWSKLHHGPLWSGLSDQEMNTMKVHSFTSGDMYSIAIVHFRCE